MLNEIRKIHRMNPKFLIVVFIFCSISWFKIVGKLIDINLLKKLGSVISKEPKLFFRSTKIANKFNHL